MRTLLVLVLLTSLAVSCGPSGPADPLLDRSFTSIEVIEDGEPRELADGPIEVEFEARDDRHAVGWRAGCNSFSGWFEITEQRLRLADDWPEGFSWTDVACDDELHAQDDWLVEVFTAEPVWSLEGDVLTLQTDTETLRLEGS